MSWQDQDLDDDYWHDAIHQSINRRAWLNLEPNTNGYRLVNAESDGIPGLIIDKYDDYLVFQCLTKGIDSRKEQILEQLQNLTARKYRHTTKFTDSGNFFQPSLVKFILLCSLHLPKVSK